MSVGNTISFMYGKTFKVTTHMECYVKNLIYLIQCCSRDKYIGETGDSLRHQMTVYRQHIRYSNVRTLRISNHIASCARNVLFNLSYSFVLNKVKQDSLTIRQMKVSYFINFFNSKLYLTFYTRNCNLFL